MTETGAPPGSFHLQYAVGWSNWCLEHGTPDLPPLLGLYESVPVARFVGARVAAVLHVGCELDDFLGTVDLFSTITIGTRTASGWELSSEPAGGRWGAEAFARPRSLAPSEVWIYGWHRGGGADWSATVAFGVAGSEAATIELIDGDGTHRREIESPFGAFVACGDSADELLVRIRDAGGALLLEERYRGEQR